jgi:hypothetical protein
MPLRRGARSALVDRQRWSLSIGYFAEEGFVDCAGVGDTAVQDTS